MRVIVNRAVTVPEKPDRMNKTERAWATLLDARVKAGELREVHFEGVTLKLADDMLRGIGASDLASFARHVKQNETLAEVRRYVANATPRLTAALAERPA